MLARSYINGSDDSFKALAEPTRRAILEMIRDKELPAGDIGAQFSVTRSAISQHLTILKGAGLVTERRDRTRRLYRANPTGLLGLKQFVDRFWSTGLERLKDEVERDASR
jgi:DNA-binding transcriptional ArsR family regulator